MSLRVSVTRSKRVCRMPYALATLATVTLVPSLLNSGGRAAEACGGVLIAFWGCIAIGRMADVGIATNRAVIAVLTTLALGLVLRTICAVPVEALAVVALVVQLPLMLLSGKPAVSG